MKFSGKVGSGPMNNDYLDTGKTCLGGGMHYLSASSYLCATVWPGGRGNVSSRVCLSASEQTNSKTRVWILVKFG